MAVSVSYPGVYVEEFTPGAPIAGVGTGTAAFVGVALAGPAAEPTRISSWDEYVSTFGGFPVNGSPSQLAQGVYAFFLNGGTDCFVLRVSTGSAATAELPDRSSVATPGARVTARAGLTRSPAGEPRAVVPRPIAPTRPPFPILPAS